MRSYTEPTARNLLRRPLVFGVSPLGLSVLAFTVLGISSGFGQSLMGNGLALGAGLVGYGWLRVLAAWAKPGWEEVWIWRWERRFKRKAADGKLEWKPSEITVHSPDTLAPEGLIDLKEELRDRITALKPGEPLRLVCRVDGSGARLDEITALGSFDLSGAPDWSVLSGGILKSGMTASSLYSLPVTTDPLWLAGLISKLPGSFSVLLTLRGLEFKAIKRRIETARQASSSERSKLSDVDAEVTFEEASRVLTGISRGDEVVVEASMVIVGESALELDPALFCREKVPELAVASGLGLRKRSHRSLVVRAVTACDLVPSLGDPVEEGPAILTTLRGKPLYFSPDDSRLEALHWLVVGATGSGKSFFTGLMLSRMMASGKPMSVLFVDHNRSFRRLVGAKAGRYIEPASLGDLEQEIEAAIESLGQPGQMAGIELSDLLDSEKKMATRVCLRRLETFLRSRDSSHPIYVVLDECWNFMRDEPVLVQRAFREFRKLNGGAIAVTQSLSDFLTDESGRSIFQNAAVRVLLRQGEDLGPYQGALALNSVELRRVRTLRQKKGVFSECLIKTPFLSRLGRLYPTEEEHQLLRTDNIREEQIALLKSERTPIQEALA